MENTEKYWCNHCDHALVDPAKPASGKFFVVSGHSLKDDEWTTIRFALCATCYEKGLDSLIQENPNVQGT